MAGRRRRRGRRAAADGERQVGDITLPGAWWEWARSSGAGWAGLGRAEREGGWGMEEKRRQGAGRAKRKKAREPAMDEWWLRG